MLHTLPKDMIDSGRQTAFKMSGHTADKYNLIYNQVGEHKGCPRFASVAGMQLYLLRGICMHTKPTICP